MLLGPPQRRLLLEPGVALLLELERHLLAAGADDAPVDQHVDEVRNDVVQQPLVVRDDQHRALGAAQLVDALGHDPQRVDVEARVGLVEDRELWLEHRHLEDLVSLLLAAREAFVDRALHELLVDLDELRLLLHERQELDGVELAFALVSADRVERRLQEVDVAHAGNLDRVLEGEEYTLARALLRLEREQVLALVEHLALRDRVAGPARQHVRERALARAVRAHDGVHLGGAHGEVEAAQDVAAAGAGVEIPDLEHGEFEIIQSVRKSQFLARIAFS